MDNEVSAKDMARLAGIPVEKMQESLDKMVQKGALVKKANGNYIMTEESEKLSEKLMREAPEPILHLASNLTDKFMAEKQMAHLNVFWCQFCDRKFPYSNDAKEHTINAHPEPFKNVTPEELAWRENHRREYAKFLDTVVKAMVEKQAPGKAGKIDCVICNKQFDSFVGLAHHWEFDHSTAVNQEVDYSKFKYSPDSENAIINCTFCPQQFDSIDELQDHIRNIHNRELNPKYEQKIEQYIDRDGKIKEDPLCEKCHKQFIGVVFTQIKSQHMAVCVNCYEDYWGKEALDRVVRGTPPAILEKMRKPIEKT